MTIKPYKIWTLLKLKNGNQKIVRVGYVKFTLIEHVFLKKVKKPELSFTDQVILYNVLKTLIVSQNISAISKKHSLHQDKT